MKAYHLLPVAALLLAACGGGEPAADTDASEAAPSAEESAPAETGGPSIPSGSLTVPEWYQVDHDAQSVSMTLVAGATSDNNYWNYNGAVNGEWAITVPEGYEVTIELVNEDPNMAHSVGISSELESFAVPPAPDPVFEGAITENPQSMTQATMPGESETITFVADQAGNYSLVCYIPGHTAVGMWLYFTVSEGDAAGVAGM
ncbi:MAG: sulfocyanin-like copper-binding protein [Longimicrobiales bacterium]|nr:sulfocyanin-like copper-binding protein [Longimicrobiales bacterium]